MIDIKFPIIRINSRIITDSEELIPLWDNYMYSSKPEIFKTYFLHKEFVDSKGQVFRVISRIPTDNHLRKIFKFLPGVYREKLVFEKVDKVLKLEEFKEDLIKGIKKFSSESSKEVEEDWINDIQNSKTFAEVINGK
ncbi:MAG: hypothetical protein COA80_19430 [Leeuwenhoekiella sp.]|nr:MAG: hypothetical protein COA80_19430 [Leeuwenhoekiella sp.]